MCIKDIKKTECIKNPENIDWINLWQKKVSKKRKKPKNWDKEASKFSKRSKQDEYQENLLSKMRISKEDSVLDLGCGEGSITIPLANVVKKVTAVDSSEKMLEILESKCEKEKITNIEIIKENLEDITLDHIGKHDIVLLSRSINGIYKIKETLTNINNIANKYVYITLFGPSSWKFEKGFYESIHKKLDEPRLDFAPYSYLFNILVNMQICPNVENIEIKTSRSYDSIEDAMNNGRLDLDSFTKQEKDKLHDYLKKNLIKNKKGKLEHSDDKSDWILIWWKK